MSDTKSTGGALKSGESTEDERRAAASAMGRVRSERKTKAAQQNGLSGGRKKGTLQTDESRQKMAEARKALWQDPEYRARVLAARAAKKRVEADA